MGRQAKCKYCNQLIPKNEHIIIIEYTKTGNEKKIHLHKKCENEYKELMQYKKNEIKWFNETYEYIKELLGYNADQILPKYLVTRLQDLRNGTIIKKGVGRIIKSKEGYPYEIIIDTVLQCSDKIKWAFNNKVFKKEKNKINYMMAIVENNINDVYIKHNNKQNRETIEKRNNLSQDEKIIKKTQEQLTKIKQPCTIISSTNGITKFLEEDEL